jgi:hypothetical protein
VGRVLLGLVGKGRLLKIGYKGIFLSFERG